MPKNKIIIIIIKFAPVLKSIISVLKILVHLYIMADIKW